MTPVLSRIQSREASIVVVGFDGSLATLRRAPKYEWPSLTRVMRAHGWTHAEAIRNQPTSAKRERVEKICSLSLYVLHARYKRVACPSPLPLPF